MHGVGLQAVQVFQTVRAVQAVQALQAVQVLQTVPAVHAVQAVGAVQVLQTVPALQAVGVVGEADGWVTLKTADPMMVPMPTSLSAKKTPMTDVESSGAEPPAAMNVAPATSSCAGVG